MKRIIIAIDGFSACGKSTTAKRVAEQLNYIYVDTGAMYRAVSLYLLRNEIPFDGENPQLHDALEKIRLRFELNPESKKPEIILNDENVERYIRTMEVSSIVSEVSALSSVRRMLVAQQQQMGEERGIVMDGRDIGTVVFPEAELKIFMTADMEKRVKRRMLELELKGTPLTAAEVRENLQHRDRIDSSREDSPLTKADDALILDTSDRSIRDQVNFVLEYADKIIHFNYVPKS